MARVTPEEYASKWNRRTKAAIGDWSKGIEGVTVSPTAEAAKNLDRAAQNFASAVSSGRMGRSLNNISLEQWRQKTLQKGSARIGQGVDAAMDTQREMASRLLTAVDQSAAKANALPKGSISDSIQRVSAFIESMHSFRGKI